MTIAITGYGIISAIGNNAAETLTALQEERSGVGKMRYLQSTHDTLPVGEVKLTNEEMAQMLSLPEDRIVSRTTLMGAIAVKQALHDAGLTPAMLQDKRVAIVSGTTVGGMDITERYFKELQKNDDMLHYIEQHDCGSGTRDIADILSLDCEVSTISTACSSAINSIIVGTEMLRRDETDIVIAGGTEALSRFHLNGFNTLMILDHEQCKPFDRNRVGLNLGEGAAFVVLQRDAAAAKAYIGGYGNRCDAFHQTASSENGEGAYLAMTDALTMSGLKPTDIDYINAHGTGTPNNDMSESAALRRIFGNNQPAISSTKSFTGHTTSASGSIETVICLLAMQHGFIPRSLNCSTPDDACVTPCMETKAATLHNVICNAFGFGGNDSSLLLTAEPHNFDDTAETYDSEIVADVTIDDAEQLKDSKEFISPMAARRMGKLMKAATLSSLKALKAAETDCPDAIITATAYGMMETSEKFLIDMLEHGEDTLSPTLFMQSTHNTLSSAIAIRTKCHGYNITYSQGADSLTWALRDARRLIATGRAKTVLVGCHDEATAMFQSFFERMKKPAPKAIYSRSIVLKRVEK